MSGQYVTDLTESYKRWLGVLKDHAADMYETLRVAKDAQADMEKPGADAAQIANALIGEIMECLDTIETALGDAK